MPFVAAFAAAYPILFSVLMAVGTTVIGAGLQMAFRQKPKNPILTGQDRTITVKQPVSPHKTIYGASRVGGTIFFLERVGTGNTADVWIGIVWASHECKAIDSIYADDEQIFVNNDGSVRGARAGQILIYNHLGAVDQTADTALSAAFPLKWTQAHRLRGRCYSIIELIDIGTNWENTIPNFSADIRGKLLIDSRTGESVYTDNAVQCIRSEIMDVNAGLGESASRIDTQNFNAESNVCDEELPLPSYSENWVFDGANISSTFTVSDLTLNRLLGGLSESAFAAVFATGDIVQVSNSGGGLPSPLAPSTDYYIRLSATLNLFFLYTTLADALADTNRIDITTNGTGTHTVHSRKVLLRTLGVETTFTASAGADTITAAAGLHGGPSFGKVIVVESTNTLPPPLAAGTKYLFTAILTGGLRPYPVIGGSDINITGAGTGTHTMRVIAEATGTFDGSAVDTAEDTIDHGGFYGPVFAGRPVIVRLNSGSMPAPLVDGETVYVVPTTDPNKIRLARTLADAEANIHIDLTSTGTGWFLESPPSAPEMLGLTTGMAVGLAVTGGSGNLPTGYSPEMYAIRRGRGLFQLAGSLADALAGNATVPTTVGTDPNLIYRVTQLRERRYTVNGVFDSDQDKREILKGMASAIGMGAVLEPLGTGKWRVKTGRYRPPLGTLGLGDVRRGGVPEIQTRIERRSVANTIKGVYSSPLNFDQPSDFPAISDPKYVAQDGGDVLVEDITLPFTNSKWMARRIAKSWLRRKRMQRSIRFPAKLAAGFRWEYGDSLAVTIPLPSYTNKTFSVEGWEFSTDSEEGAPLPKVDLILRETGPGIWN